MEYVEAEKGYKCSDCGSVILSAPVAIHLPWMGVNPRGDRICYEYTPYCPKCEGPPRFNRGKN
jgi:hypothetical protein